METIGSFADDHRVLWREKNPTNICDWIRKALDADSQKQQCYRVYGYDIDDEIVRGAEYFRKGEAPMVEEEARYALRLMWRFLLRNYALCESCRIGRILKDWGEPWHWRLWRRKDQLFPRLLLGVFAGFVLLSSSSGLADILAHAADPVKGRGPWFWGLLCGGPVVVFGLAVAEVQRRVGRRAWGVIASRAGIITGFGIAYSALGGWLIYAGGDPLGLEVCPRFAAACASAALLLGFVIQLFWQERAIGDPL